MHIRQAIEMDLESLRDAIQAGCRELEEQYGTPNGQMILLHLADQHLEHIQIAEEEGRVIGYCMWIPGPYQGTLIGAGTWVHPAHRKKGVSERLRDEALEYWIPRGGKSVVGTVSAQNVAGQESLKRWGFRTTGLEVTLDFSGVSR